MTIAIRQKPFLKAVLWMLALLVVAAGITIDHKYGGFSGPQPNQERALEH